MATLRQHFGAMLLDLPAMMWHCSHSDGWVRVHNRLDEIERDPRGRGLRVRAPFSSRLHVCDVYPHVGRTLLRAARRDWPMDVADAPGEPPASPVVSVIIAFRGNDRRGQLETVLRTLAANREVTAEIVIVEQSDDDTLGNLGPGSKCIHLPHPAGHPGWHKSWAYNVGARHARADILVFHDADICVPSRYLGEVVRRFTDTDLQVALLQRFLFDLDANTTRAVIDDWASLESGTVESVRQNWTGGTIAVRRECFEAIGGFDEAFVDWSGEDTDFYDRAITRPSTLFGYIPFVHLWHPPQHAKAAIKQMPVEEDRSMKRRSIPAEQRIDELQARRWGQPDGPSAPAYT